MNSKQKGKRGELELAAYLRARGFEARRGQQFKGTADSPDIITNAPELHIECKRREAGNLYTWLTQAIAEKRYDQTPVVMHRRNDRPWVAILLLDDFLKLVRKADGAQTQ